jgi:hypothetical protein
VGDAERDSRFPGATLGGDGVGGGATGGAAVGRAGADGGETRCDGGETRCDGAGGGETTAWAIGGAAGSSKLLSLVGGAGGGSALVTRCVCSDELVSGDADFEGGLFEGSGGGWTAGECWVGDRLEVCGLEVCGLEVCGLEVCGLDVCGLARKVGLGSLSARES